ncbi:DUF3857 domain-containing protein [Pontibacter populi]|uniref:DUF3857 domain-containing protein n=1 Tax=Pontibacter populi TaxID=890055 RepID=A0ABV1RPH0_9BACT
MKTTFTLPILLAILCTLSSPIVFAQAPRFGDISMSEMTMTNYEPDTAATAVILSDYGSLEIGGHISNGYEYKRHVRIKILKKTGYKWADIEIPYTSNGRVFEKVMFIKGVTYNLVNGKIREDKLKANDIFNEEVYDYKGVKKFTLPNVKVGSVIEYSYVLSSPFIFNLEGWVFQSTIPTIQSEYRVKVPDFFVFKQVKQGSHPIYSPEQLGLKHNFNLEGNRWIARNVPAIQDESYVTTFKDYVTKLEFELHKINYPDGKEKVITGNWQEFVEIISKDENFGVALEDSNKFEKPIAEIKDKYKTPAEQITGIYNLVKNSMTWNRYNSWEVDKSLDELFYGGKGDAADINMVLIGMLREAGFDANPVLISTRAHGKPYKNAPLHSKFDYVIAQVKTTDSEMLLDATEKELIPGMLPVRCLNGDGYLVKGAESKWIAITPGVAYSNYFVGNLTIDELGKLSGTGQELLDGYSALPARQTIKEDGIEKFTSNYNKGFGSLHTSGATVTYLDSLNKPLTINYKITSDNDSNVTLLYLNPVMGRGVKENPFKQPVRTYPVDFATPVKETIVCNIKIPAGWKVEEVPQSINLSLPGRGATYTYMVQQTGDILMIVSKLNVNKIIFTPEEYPQLRELYHQAVAKHAEQVVLKKEVVN